MRPVLLFLALVGILANANADQVLTPGGYVDRSQIFQIEPGQSVLERVFRYQVLDADRRVVKNIPKRKSNLFPTRANGWVSYTGWENKTGSPITSFTTTWTVPEAPKTDSGQIIYYFNGIEPKTRDAILQPVLQWGESPAGGGSYWAVANWYVTSSGQALHSPVVRVEPGTILTGVMKLTSRGGKFSYTSEFLGIENSSLPLENTAELTWANETLEAYGTGRCSDYSAANVAFTNIGIVAGLAEPKIDWVAKNQVTNCGHKVSVIDDSATSGEVDINVSAP